MIQIKLAAMMTVSGVTFPAAWATWFEPLLELDEEIYLRMEKTEKERLGHAFEPECKEACAFGLFGGMRLEELSLGRLAIWLSWGGWEVTIRDRHSLTAQKGDEQFSAWQRCYIENDQAYCTWELRSSSF